MTKQETLGVYIGRFSPFHNGHAEVIRQALEKFDRVLILVGSVNKPRTVKDPWTFDERAFMITDWLVSNTNVRVKVGDQKVSGSLGGLPATDGHQLYGSGKQVSIQPLRDEPYNDQLWLANLQRAVNLELKQHPAVAEVYLTGAKRDWTGWYLDMITYDKKFVEENYRTNLQINATDIRSAYFEASHVWTTFTENHPWLPKHTQDFMQRFTETDDYQTLVREYKFIKKYKQSWAAAPFPPTFVTVDSVVVQSGHVLLIERKKEPGRGLWALPGGFVGQNERLFDAAIRELREETRLKVPEAVLRGSVRDQATQTFDKPDRSLRGRTITTAFLFHLRDMSELPEVRGSDDAAKAKWFPISEVEKMEPQLFEDHHAITMTMLRKLES